MSNGFRTALSGSVRYHSNAGNRFADRFVLSVNKENGTQYLKKVGVTSVYDFIQSHRASCDMALLLANLDKSQVNGMINSFAITDLFESGVVDISSLPKNPGDMLNLVKEGESYFSGLPLEVRKEFNFSSHKFISEYGTKEFKEKIYKLANKQLPVEEVAEVKTTKKSRKTKVDKEVESDE